MSPVAFQLEPITASMQADILAKAVIPEHVLPLMTSVSGGLPYLVDDHLVFLGKGWLTLIGYPLEGQFSLARLASVIECLGAQQAFSTLNFIAPEVPNRLVDQCQTHEVDQYLVLPLGSFQMTSKLRRAVRQGAARVVVQKTHAFGSDHKELVDELAERVVLPPMIEGLYEAMPRYLHESSCGWILEARDQRGHLAAFFVVDGAAPGFDIYLLGAHSKVHEIPHASDVLFQTMIHEARERGKDSLQLGLGVNPGIRRFKEKWGGQGGLPYHACSIQLRPPNPLSFLDTLLETIS